MGSLVATSAAEKTRSWTRGARRPGAGRCSEAKVGACRPARELTGGSISAERSAGIVRATWLGGGRERERAQVRRPRAGFSVAGPLKSNEHPRPLMLIDTDALLPRAELGHVALALAAVLSTYILSRWLRSESGDVRHFTVAYPEVCGSATTPLYRGLRADGLAVQQAAKGWKGRLLWNPSLASDASDSLTKTINCVDPATYELIATVPADSAADIARKVEAASVAQRAWAETTFRQRRLVMRSLLAWVQTDMEEISKVAVRDSGKTSPFPTSISPRRPHCRPPFC